MSTEGVFTALHNNLLGWSNGVGSMVGGIVAIGGLVYIGSKVLPALAKGEAIDFYPLLRPFIIGIFCLYFSFLVVTPIHYVLSPVRHYTSALGNRVQQQHSSDFNRAVASLRTQIEEERDAIARAEREELDRERNRIGRMANAIGEWFAQVPSMIGTALTNWTTGLIHSAVGIIYQIMIFVFKLLRIVFLIILNILGPIAFALAVFPKFQDNIINWLTKYISIYLWLPIVNLIVHVMHAASMVLVTSPAFTNNFSIPALQWMSVIVKLVGICALLAVPAISSWIVQGGESGGATRGFSTIAGGAGGFIGGKSGAIMGRAKNGMRAEAASLGKKAWAGSKNAYQSMKERLSNKN